MIRLLAGRAAFNALRCPVVLDSLSGRPAVRRDDAAGFSVAFHIEQEVQMSETIAVIGVGYVGLPLIVEFGKTRRTIGYDISSAKIESCCRGVDPSRELPDEKMRAAEHAEYTTDPKRLGEADFIIVSVPTPVDDAHNPDFGPLISASTSIGRNMRKGAIVVFESTVYPGATEEFCIPCSSANPA